MLRRIQVESGGPFRERYEDVLTLKNIEDVAMFINNGQNSDPFWLDCAV